MRINGYRCDGCNKEHLIPNTSIASLREPLPDDWFMVYRGFRDSDTDPWLFCSKKCLRSHSLTSSKVGPLASAEAILNHYTAPSLTIECEYDGRKYKGVIDAVEEPT